MSHRSTRLVPRSAVAVADTELLRVARTDIAPVPVPSLTDRLRSLLVRLTRADAAAEA